MHTLANSEDPDEMPQHAAFHKGLHCYLRRKRYSEKEIPFYLQNITVIPQYLQWTILRLLYNTRRKNLSVQ